jgi:hypothetical protein
MSTFSPTFSANQVYNTVTSITNVSAGTIVLNEITTNTYSNPITASGEFLGLNLNGVQKYIKIFRN